MRYRDAVASAIVGSAVLAAPAQADLAEYSLGVARDYWKESAPGTYPELLSNPGCAYISREPLPFVHYVGQPAAADYLHCRIWIVPQYFGIGYTKELWCQVIVHEYGHLLGWTHEAPYEVMQNPWKSGLVPGCATSSARAKGGIITTHMQHTIRPRRKLGRFVMRKRMRWRVIP